MKLNSHGAGGAKIHIVKIYCKVLGGGGREGGSRGREYMYIYSGFMLWCSRN